MKKEVGEGNCRQFKDIMICSVNDVST